MLINAESFQTVHVVHFWTGAHAIFGNEFPLSFSVRHLINYTSCWPCLRHGCSQACPLTFSTAISLLGALPPNPHHLHAQFHYSISLLTSSCHSISLLTSSHHSISLLTLSHHSISLLTLFYHPISLLNSLCTVSSSCPSSYIVPSSHLSSQTVPSFCQSPCIVLSSCSSSHTVLLLHQSPHIVSSSHLPPYTVLSPHQSLRTVSIISTVFFHNYQFNN